MIIDGTNISNFKLKLIDLGDYYNLPARKKNLTVPGTEAADIVFQQNTATFQLLGRFSNAAELLDKLNDFETLLKSSLKHDVELVGHNETFTGVFNQGYEVLSFNGGRIVKITLPVIIIDN